MDAVGKTAYYCCGVRAADALSPKPICGDVFAQRFMTGEGETAFKPFVGLSRPNTSNATRARIIDDFLRARIAATGDQQVFLVGAGFDTRAFRIGGGRWIEFDQPGLLERKNKHLPIPEAKVPLQRIAIDFGKEKLAEKLKPWAGTKNAVVVLEGVTEYLTQEQQMETFNAIASTFPGVTLICDLMSSSFVEKTAKSFRAVLRSLGTDFVPQRMEPWLTAQETGFELVSRTSIVGRSREIGAISIPWFLFHTILRAMRDGYCVYEFKGRN